MVCGDTAALPKPAPDPILLCLKQLGATASCSLMVGDSVTDVDAAKAAQLDVACYRDGYNHGIDVVTLKPTLVFDRMDEILPTSA